MTRALLALGLTGCAATGMHQLRAPSVPATAELPPDCAHDCDREQKREVQTWREVPGVDGERVRIVVTGDAGVRDAPLSRAPVLADGPLRVAELAGEVCGGSCEASVFLGDNVYPGGIGRGSRGERDRGSLQEFRDAYAFTPDAYFVLGNHDWGAFPGALNAVCQLGLCEDVGQPSRARAQRQLEAIRQMEATHGDAHFWETELGPVHAVAIDTVYLSRRCKGPEVRCRGDARAEKPLREAIDTMLSGDGGAHTVVFGHHPRVGNGAHGSAGEYRDIGPFSLGRGEAVEAVLDEQVARSAGLYFAGHDHSVQVHDDGEGMLSLVVGAGGKVSPPGRATEPEGRRREDLAFEAWCRLGFAIVDAGPEDLAVQVYTLEAPAGHDGDCPTVAPERRPAHMAAQTEKPDATLGAVAPEGDLGNDLRCVRWELEGERWSARQACELVDTVAELGGPAVEGADELDVATQPDEASTLDQ